MGHRPRKPLAWLHRGKSSSEQYISVADISSQSVASEVIVRSRTANSQSKSLLPSTACSKPHASSESNTPVTAPRNQVKGVPTCIKSDTFKEATWPTPHIPFSLRRVCAEIFRLAVSLTSSTLE
jgi:hypothetical protein